MNTSVSPLPFYIFFYWVVFILCSGFFSITTVASKTSQTYIPVSFSKLQSWDKQSNQEVKQLLLMSCELILKKKHFPTQSILGTKKQWQEISRRLKLQNNQSIKTFIEHNFQVYQLKPDDIGLFTGYFTPVYEGRRTRQTGFETPILRPSILKSYITRNDTRKTIQEKLQRIELNSAYVLAWLRSIDDLFFLQIQGSGVIQLKNEKIFAGFGGSNHHNYTPIGTVLLKNKMLKTISLQSLRKWLDENPKEKNWLLNHNARYIFFNETENIAITASQIPAIPFKSLAVDPVYIPLGSLIWIETTITQTKQPFQKLMIAHDTGAAIKGPVRADIYMGMGKKAASTAGLQKETGQLFIITLKHPSSKKQSKHITLKN